jgi:cell pole-organizing protein PopZ
MSDPKAQSEPTMEEILASIRRIISENDEEQETRKREEEEEEQQRAAAAAASVPKSEPAGVAVLELTEMIAEDGSVVSLTGDGEERVAEQAVHEAVVEASIQEAVEASAETKTGEDIESRDEHAGKAEVAMENPKDDSVEFAPSTGSTGKTGGSAQQSPDEGLLSSATAAAATATFAELARTMAQEPSASGNMPLGSGRTLEDLVKEMLRPMLKEWLDTNLPPMVEHMVRRELDRMTRKAEGIS